MAPHRLFGRFENLSNHVGRLVLGLVIGAGLELGEQPHGHELEAAEDQEDAKEERRPVGNRLRADQAAQTRAIR